VTPRATGVWTCEGRRPSQALCGIASMTAWMWLSDLTRVSFQVVGKGRFFCLLLVVLLCRRVSRSGYLAYCAHRCCRGLSAATKEVDCSAESNRDVVHMFRQQRSLLLETLECPRVVSMNEDAKLRDQHEVGTSGSEGMRGDKITQRSLDARGERSCEMSGIGRSTQ
jgi:hypothetical protein